MARELTDWLTGYLEYTQNSESPRSFHVWCGLSLLAAALQRKVYLSWGFEKIYPNLYIVLVGPSGSRKGLALGIAKNLLVNIPGISVAPESSSGREAMVLAMKRANGNFTDQHDGKIKFHCSLTAFSEEMSVFLGQKDIKYLSNLTDWYDSKDDWRYETVGRGLDTLQGLCFNLAAATAPDWMQSMLPQEAIGGGFTARIIFIVEERKGKTVAKHQLTAEESALEGKLARDLERINQLTGPATFTPAGEKAYTEWYEVESEKSQRGEYAIPDDRFSAYCERRQTHVRKLLLGLSASRGDSLLLDKIDFDHALMILRAAEGKMHKAFGGLGKGRNADATEQVREFIRVQGVATRSSLMAKFYRDLDAPTLKVVEESLVQAGMLQVELLVGKNDKLYRWIGDK